MTRNKSDQNKEIFEKYIQNKQILVIDPVLSSRTGLAKLLVDMGAKTHHISLASSFQTGKEELEKKRPNLVLCEYEIQGASGLELLQFARENIPHFRESIFVLITSNNSQSAVAQAAEEEVDGFILKPYNISVFRQILIKLAAQKIQPSPYYLTIEKGKNLLRDHKIEEALTLFKDALSMDPKPALAYSYIGQIDFIKKVFETAELDYNNGLNHNKIHYKCMVGLYDVLMEQKQSQKAYEVVKRISRYFPANPQRLAAVLRLAIMTKSYDDIERYYQLFLSIDRKGDELIRYICAALVVCAKYYLQTKLPSRALELLQRAAITSGGRPKILREIITSLCEYNQVGNADEFLERFPVDQKNSPDYHAMYYLISDSIPGALASGLVDKGRKLVQQQIYDPLIYQILIKRSIEAGFKDSADQLTLDATKRWPEFKLKAKAA